MIVKEIERMKIPFLSDVFVAVAVVRKDDLFCQKWYIKGKISASPQDKPLSGAGSPSCRTGSVQ